jgi:hypothetical protein
MHTSKALALLPDDCRWLSPFLRHLVEETASRTIVIGDIDEWAVRRARDICCDPQAWDGWNGSP